MDLNEWTSLVRELKPTDALVFVHGFNTDFDAAAFRLAQIVWDLRLPKDLRWTGEIRGPLPVLFSWPSLGATVGYRADLDKALISRDPFIELLNVLKAQGIERIHVLAHSMGNFVVVEALAKHAITTNPLQIAELIMAAPDVDVGLFLPALPALQKVARGLTLYASANDRAMQISRGFALGNTRAGDIVNNRPVFRSGIDTIDVSAMGEELFGLNHNTFATNRSLIDDIGILLKEGRRSPRLPQLRPVPEDRQPPDYWRFVR